MIKRSKLKTRGSRASRSGKVGEAFIEGALTNLCEQGFVKQDLHRLISESYAIRQWGYYRDVVGRHSKAKKVDFFVRLPVEAFKTNAFVLGESAADIVIEVKNQESSGTTDEKIPYVMLNLRHMKPPNKILCLSGSWWREHTSGICFYNWANQWAVEHSNARQRFFVLRDDDIQSFFHKHFKRI